MSSYVELINLAKVYPQPSSPTGKLVVLENFNLEIAKGEFVTLIGHSGCGKSTVLTMIAGLNDITDGDVVVDNRTIDGPGPDRGVVFQAPCLLPWMSALDNVMLGVQRVYPTASKREHHEVCEHYLSLVGLGNALHKRPAELSQGMQQRVGIARAFAIAPKLLLLDEPFGMLDSLTRMELQEVLLTMLEVNRTTALQVTHDVDEALFLADRVIMMTNGPNAKVGRILQTPFERPRVRTDVLEHPDYYELRAELIRFLEEQEHQKHDDQDAA